MSIQHIGKKCHAFFHCPQTNYRRWASCKLRYTHIQAVALAVILFSHCNAFAQANPLPELYKQLLPSVVTLHTFENEISTRGVKLAVNSNGLGSGVLISQDGLIITDAHVVQTTDALHVEFSDGQRRSGRVLSSLPWVDLALVKVDRPPKNLVVAKLGDSNKVMVGEQVFVIGAPLGLSNTLTVGFISGRHSQNEDNDMPLAEFFQTDAAINSGNSGGPLFNMKGEVIGIASYIKTQSGGSDGLGFTVTSESIQQYILKRGHFWSGLKFFVLNADLARAFHIPQAL